MNSRFTMYGAYKVLFERTGVTAEIVDPGMKPDPKTPNAKPVVENLRLMLTVAPDAALGDREFRVGEELTSVVQAARLQDKIHDLQRHIDPIIVLSDVTGRELATSDDYFRADPLLTYRVEKDGEYLLQVRDVRYMGDPRWTYVLTATNRPFVAAVFPLAVKRGRATPLEPVGFALGGMNRTELHVPMDWSCGPRCIQLKAPSGLSNPVPVIVSDLEEAIESEPNDDFQRATPLAIPGGMSGRIGTENVRLRHLGGVFGDPLPPGITMDESASKTLLGENATQGSIVLKAAPNAAPVEDLPIAILGHVSINFVVKTTYSSPPISLSLTPMVK